MIECIKKLDLKSDKNFFYLNKKINEISDLDIKFIKENYLDKDKYHLIIKNFSKSPAQMKKNIVNFSKIFGKLLKQDKYGKLIAEITPSVKKIKKKKSNLRYHQTNTGGNIHSDGPQLNNPPKYVLMACKKQAERGGYSILSSIEKILVYLKKYDKKTLSILKKEFFFEKRGFYFKNQSKVLKKPIIQLFKKDLRFRYLRDYMNQAYKINSIVLPKTQSKALDKLDNLLSKKQYQYKFKLEEGDILLINNFKLAHGRSSFSIKNNSNRSFFRLWFK
jgi:alpha-ketoglutarate-dependent taurine dioxygenase